ncbi:MAG: hypothetical protein QOH47_846 [Sphingomonadales bacterium]|jgi:hypothetical protein|nr:hypothetical protein [Sphingomonadales bacterium]
MTALAYLDEHRGYIGSSGSGKSTTARVDVEQLLRELRHTCVIDLTGIWYGTRSDRAGTGPGFDIPIFGGRRGDVPIGAGDGGAIGKIVGDGVSAIVDLSSLRTGRDQRQFLADFIASIRAKPPGHFQLVCDEADEYIPEKGGIRDSAHQQVAEDMIWIAKRGRSDGYVLSIITQRLADVANAAFGQVQTIFAHQLTQPDDKAAFGKYIKGKGTKAEFTEIMSGLDALQVGQRYLYRPRLHILELGTTPLPTTFDSSRTPGPGEARREPKLLSQIDVRAIAKLLEKPKIETAIAAYEAGSEVGELLAAKALRIRELTDKVGDLEVERDQLLAHVRGEFLELEQSRARLGIYENLIVNLGLAIDDAQIEIGRQATTAGPTKTADDEREESHSSDPVLPHVGGGEAPKASANRRPRSASPAPKPSGDDQNLRRGRKALLPLAKIYPARLSEAQWATLAGFSKTGGTWGTYKGALRVAGYIDQDGDKWGATRAGVQASGIDPEPLPAPGAQLAVFWGSRIPGARRMVDVLVKRSPHFTTRDALAADLGMSAAGGTFGTYLGRLRTNGLLEENGKKVRLSAAIMGLVG